MSNFKWVVVISLAILLPSLLSANDLVNGMLTPGKGRSLPGWSSLSPQNPFVIDRSGNAPAVKGHCDGPKEPPFGLKQVVRYKEPSTDAIKFSGWSKAEKVAPGGEYCLYLDLKTADGKILGGITARWKQGTHDWEFAQRVYKPRYPIVEIRVYALLRETSGTAYFRDLSLEREKK